MRNRILGTLLAITLLLTACGEDKTATTTPPAPAPQKPKGEPTLAEFNIRSLSGSGFCRFIGVIGSTNFLIDSIPVPQDGRLTLKQDTALPGGLYFLVLPNQSSLQFLLDQDQTFTLTTDANNLIGAAQVQGSEDNQLLYDNLRWENQFQSELQPINQALATAVPGSAQHTELSQQQKALVDKRIAYIQAFKTSHPNAFFTAYKLAGQNPALQEPKRPDGSLDTDLQVFYYRNAYWDNTPLSDERLLHTPIISNKLITYITQITPQVHDSVTKYADIIIEKSRVNPSMFKFVVNWIAIEYNKPKTMGLESVYIHVIDKYFTDDQNFWNTKEELADIRKSADGMRVSLIGQIGQDLRCKNTSGQYETLYGLNSPWTVVWIWNYECEHCQERTPAMKKVAAQFKHRGLEVYSLCTGMEEKPWKDFIQKYGIQGFHNVWDPQYESDYYKKYHVDNTPELYLLDKDHRIVAKDLHPDQLTEELNRRLGN